MLGLTSCRCDGARLQLLLLGQKQARCWPPAYLRRMSLPTMLNACRLMLWQAQRMQESWHLNNYALPNLTPDQASLGAPLGCF